MTLYRPNADDVDGTWLNEASGSTLYTSLDETTASDTDYIQTPLSPVFERCRVAMDGPSGLVQPFIVRYRYNNSGTSLRVRLVQGASTEIAAWTHEQQGWNDAVQTLTDGQFALITDSSDLFVEFTATNATLDLDFQQSDTLDSRITFSRPSTAWRFNSSGLLESVGSNVARRDFDPVTKLAKGLLIETQSVNQTLWNRDLTNVVWAASDITAALDQTGLTGVANSASSITASASNATVLQTRTATSRAFFLSAYVKRITGSGTVEMTLDNGATWTAVTVGSSWARVSIPGQTLVNPIYGFRLTTSGDAIAVDGVQLEELTTFATSVMLTTTASVLRSADSLDMTGSNFTSWFNQSAGTFAAEFSLSSLPSGGNRVYTVEQIATGTDISYVTVNGGVPEIRCTSKVAGVAQADLVLTGAIAVNTRYDVAHSLAANDFAATKNGGTVVTDTTGSMPPGMDNLSIGKSSSSESVLRLNGWLRSLAFWPAALSDAQIQAIST